MFFQALIFCWLLFAIVVSYMIMASTLLNGDLQDLGKLVMIHLSAACGVFFFQDSKVWTFTPPKTSKEPETTPLEKEKETSNQTTDF